MTEAFDVDLGAELRDALRHEAYRLQVGLSAGALTARLQADEQYRRVRMPVYGLVAAVVGFAFVVSVGALFSSPRPPVGGSAPPGGSPCPESPPTRHGRWWVEIGGPKAFFNVDPSEAHHATTTGTRWLLIVRFDPDAASPDDLSVWATNLSAGTRLEAVLNSRMEPGSIARFDEPAPPLPGGWYLFEQAIPTGGCWQLTAEVEGELAGSATVDVLPAGPDLTAEPNGPTPAVASPDATMAKVSCLRMDPPACETAVALVRSPHFAAVDRAFAIVVDDVCPPGVICDRAFPFMVAVVLVPEPSSVAAPLAYLVVGSWDRPERVLSPLAELPQHLSSAVIDLGGHLDRRYELACGLVEEPQCSELAFNAVLAAEREYPIKKPLSLTFTGPDGDYQLMLDDGTAIGMDVN